MGSEALIRADLIRIASEHPETRRRIVPLLREYANRQAALPKPNLDIVRNEVFRALKPFGAKKVRSLKIRRYEMQIPHGEGVFDAVVAAVNKLPGYSIYKTYRDLVILITTRPPEWRNTSEQNLSVQVSRNTDFGPITVAVESHSKWLPV